MRKQAIIATLIVTGLSTLAGCGHDAQVVLDQDFAPPSQRQVLLNSDIANFAEAGPRIQAAATFALPGSTNGPRAFVLYLNAPAQQGPHAVDAESTTQVRGFLIQLVGHLAGRTDFARGTVEIDRRWLAPDRRKITLDITCTDGTHIAGRVSARRNADAVHALKREFAADVAEVTGAAPTTRPGTAPRNRRVP